MSKNKRIQQIKQRMDSILDMPIKHQTDKIWNEYEELEKELERLEK